MAATITADCPCGGTDHCRGPDHCQLPPRRNRSPTIAPLAAPITAASPRDGPDHCQLPRGRPDHCRLPPQRHQSQPIATAATQITLIPAGISGSQRQSTWVPTITNRTMECHQKSHITRPRIRPLYKTKSTKQKSAKDWALKVCADLWCRCHKRGLSVGTRKNIDKVGIQKCVDVVNT